MGTKVEKTPTNLDTMVKKRHLKFPGRGLHHAVAVSFIFLGFILFCDPSLWRLFPPAHKSNDDEQKRAFVCITGQVSRLELDSKIRTLLKPLQKAGFTPDVALVLSESSDDNRTFWTKPNQHIQGGHRPAFNKFQDASNHLTKYGFHVVSKNPYVQVEQPILRPDYVEKLRKTTSDKSLQRRAENNLRMMAGWSRCYQEMISSGGGSYDVCLRIRDDHGLTHPLPIDKILPSVKSRTVMSTDCQKHSGMNDRFAIMSTDAAYDYFVGPISTYYLGHLDSQVRNTETLIRHVYEKANLTIINSPMIRGLVKMQVNSNGSTVVYEDHDTVRCMVMNGE
jgi:hypothetical protein